MTYFFSQVHIFLLIKTFLDIIRKRLKIPLAELLNRMAEAKEYIPILKIMPKKVSDVEISIYELRE